MNGSGSRSLKAGPLDQEKDGTYTGRLFMEKFYKLL